VADSSIIKKIIGNLVGFIETKMELIKLDFREEMSMVISKILLILTGILLFFYLTMFISLTVVNYINQVYSSNFIGHGIVSIFYLVMFLIYFLLRRNKILYGIVNEKIKKYLK